MAHTKYVCNHEFGKGPEFFHLASCPQVADLENRFSRNTVGEEGAAVVTNRMPAAVRLRPNLGYSDDRAALMEQGFMPCETCAP